MSNEAEHDTKLAEVQEKLSACEQELDELVSDYALTRRKLEELEEQLSQASKEAGEYLDLLKRQKADFENYKKRMVKERQQIVGWAVADLMKGLLPVLDDFERAMESAESSQDFSSLAEGIKMVYEHLKQFLEGEGLAEISAEGQSFDPHIHEAMMRVESNDHPDNVVMGQLRKGYMYKGQVLRPSMVQVNRRSARNSDSER